MAEPLKRTSLYDIHLSLHARMVPFAGWEMPVQYTSILAEVRDVRQRCGLFDVSHMGRLELSGPDAVPLLEWVETNGVADLPRGRGRYSFICNLDGGIIDDTIYYRRNESECLLVCNAANRAAVVAWLERWRRERFPRVTLDDQTERTAMIAVQGPLALNMVDGMAGGAAAGLKPFAFRQARLEGADAFIARTGYTGEDGVELVTDAERAASIWRKLMEKGASACGLGARDVLRLEAALMLHGNDIDPTTTPLEAGQERFVRLDKESAGAEALRRQSRPVGTGAITRKLVGLKLMGNGIARHGYPILSGGRQVGHVTSGTYSPTLEASIAMGYVEAVCAAPDTRLAVDLRGRALDAVVVPLPFYSRKRSA